VGKRLSASSRISVRPFGRCVRWPRTCLRHRRIRFWVPSRSTPAFRETRGEEGRRSYSLPPASDESQRGAPLRPTPFWAPRMRTPRGPSRTLWSLHRIVSTSDVPVVTGRHTRVGILSARCAVLSSACRPCGLQRLTWSWPAGQRTLLRMTGWEPYGQKPENAFRRLQNPRAETHRRCAANVCSTIEAHPYRFAFCPSAPVRQAVLRISSWLAPSLTTARPCDPPLEKTRDTSNRLLPPNRITCTRTSCVPNSLRWLPSADAPRRLRLRTA